MKSINEIDKEILILKYYYGYTYRDIGDKINLKEANIRKRCERAKKNILRDIINKEVK